MSRLAKTLCLTAAIFAGASRHAAAQSRPPRPPFDRTPRFEAGLIAGGLWTLDHRGRSGTEARFTVNRTTWLAAEASVDIKPADADVPQRQSLVILNARVQASEGDTSAYLTAGLAAASGLDRSLSPMLGFGIGFWRFRIVSWRAELQTFPGGTMHLGQRGGRVTLTLAVAIP